MSLKQQILLQFQLPHGYLGHVAGLIMANRPSNIERNEWTLELLDLLPSDRVLEIGFGPGIAIQKASQRVTDGSITGIDHSQTMLYQAKKRNALSIAQGKVHLYLGSVDKVASLGYSFNKIYTINVVQFWNNLEESFVSLYNVLEYGGEVATTYMPRHSGATNADARDKSEEIEQVLRLVGYGNIQVKEKTFNPVNAICVLAQKILHFADKRYLYFPGKSVSCLSGYVLNLE